MKVQSDGSGGRVVLGDSTGGGAVMLRLIRFRYFGVWISTRLTFLYTDI
jgi:hypothetical protein